MKPIAIYGAGGFAREALQIIRDINALEETWDFQGFLSDTESEVGMNVHEYTVLGGKDWIKRHPETHLVIAIGNPWTKAKIVEGLNHPNYATLIHPRALVGHNCKIGVGSILCAYTILTVDISFGNHVILNIGCMVGHDTVVGDYCTINPTTNLSGNVTVKQGVLIGTQCSIIPGVTVDEWTILGAASCVTADIPPNCTAVGIPAKAIKHREPGWHLG